MTCIKIYTKPGAGTETLKKKIKTLLGDDFKVQNRYEQNETLYKMMSSEKISIYIILLFVVVIISCNLFGSLSMLIMEKKEDAVTLKSLGANDLSIKKIFLAEGWLISLSGILTGTIVALLFGFMQQQFGIIPMPGNFIVESYPIIIKFTDVLLTISGIAIIGLLSAMLPFMIVKKVENF